MDWVNIRSRAEEFYKKYRYVLLVILLGIVLMCLPARRIDETDPSPPAVKEGSAQSSLEVSLAAILSQIKGAGKVEVLLTEAKGAETVYQSDADTGNGTERLNTVIVSGSDRTQAGLVRQINPPSYLGAIIVCQGADSATVRLAIVQAVASVTGLGSDRITVLKMK